MKAWIRAKVTPIENSSRKLVEVRISGEDHSSAVEAEYIHMNPPSVRVEVVGFRSDSSLIRLPGDIVCGEQEFTYPTDRLFELE